MMDGVAQLDVCGWRLIWLPKYLVTPGRYDGVVVRKEKEGSKDVNRLVGIKWLQIRDYW